MQLVDLHVTGILESYVKIQNAESGLQKKWRKPLLEVYTQQRARYQDELKKYNQERLEFSRRLRIGVWMASILLLLGILVLPALFLINEIGNLQGPLFCFSPLLILSGLTGWGIIIILWFWQRDHEKPRPPKNPLKTNLFPPLIPIWKEGLITTLPGEKTDPEETGEFHFITRLLSLPDDAYILYGIQLHPGEDIDVILVGRMGIWVFEVNYLPGIIRWRNGVWTQVEPGKRLASNRRTRVTELGVFLEERWQNSVDDVSNLLSIEASGLVKQNPGINKIRGGLVFTHPKGKYDIPPGCPFNWGIIPFWLEKLQSVPSLDKMDDAVIMNILEILLKRHQQVAGLDEPRSMLVLADSVVNHAEKNINSWIESRTPANEKAIKLM